jgi:hypothetical protein
MVNNKKFMEGVTKDMTLRQVLDYTLTIPVEFGALCILMDRVVTDIECINKWIDKHIEDHADDGR